LLVQPGRVPPTTILSAIESGAGEGVGLRHVVDPRWPLQASIGIPPKSLAGTSRAKTEQRKDAPLRGTGRERRVLRTRATACAPKG
jgi:hypothetical protein